jgi:hypothetical protein
MVTLIRLTNGSTLSFDHATSLYVVDNPHSARNSYADYFAAYRFAMSL